MCHSADTTLYIVCFRNVMTSQDVVNFVSKRLKAGGTKLSVICEEVSSSLNSLVYGSILLSL